MATNYVRMLNWFKTYRNGEEWDKVSSPTHAWSIPDDIITLIPTAELGKPYTTRGHQLVTDPISMAYIPPSSLLAEVGSWFKQADNLEGGLDVMKAFQSN
jgi:hypothetical protein